MKKLEIHRRDHDHVYWTYANNYGDSFIEGGKAVDAFLSSMRGPLLTEDTARRIIEAVNEWLEERQ
jgi:hypothetical protein